MSSIRPRLAGAVRCSLLDLRTRVLLMYRLTEIYTSWGLMLLTCKLRMASCDVRIFWCDVKILLYK